MPVEPAGIVGALAGPAAEPMPIVVLTIPWMTDRGSVREVTARLCDLPGVDSIEADATTGCVVVRCAVAESVRRTAMANSCAR